jgi:hypothetical protein
MAHRRVRATSNAIVLEDLHWGDATTMGYLARALHGCRALPLMVLALARPEVTAEFPNLWPEVGRHDVSLPRLPRRAAAELVRAALGDVLGHDIVLRLVERTDGKAFYLEELVRAQAAGATDLPETVLTMVETRLDALGFGSMSSWCRPSGHAFCVGRECIGLGTRRPSNAQERRTSRLFISRAI